MRKQLTDEQAFKALVTLYTKAGLAKAAGLKNRQSATRWTKIPVKHASRVADSLGIPKRKVLPSVFG